MLRLYFILFFILGTSFASLAQDHIVIDYTKSQLNHPITDQFTLYESETELSIPDFLELKSVLKSRKLENTIENLDFTTSIFFIDFIITNETGTDVDIVLETARPITNRVWLFDNKYGHYVYSGDGIPYDAKDISSKNSALPIHVAAKSSRHYTLTLGSDGEIISLPMIFWEEKAFQQSERNQQFAFGIFYGIFLFVIIIYFTFFLLLRDRLFLFYTIYVFFSGLLQFAFDGYVHQYLFTSGGYLTQHAIIFIAGLTVFFVLHYALRYLELEGKLKKVALIFSGLVLSISFLSLIPGKIYELSYPLINASSFISVLFLLIVALRIRKKNSKISRLFVIGMFSLLTGAVIFILGNFSVIDAPLLTQNSLKTGTLIEIICLSILMAGKYKSLQEEKEQVQLQLVQELEEKNKLAAEVNIRLEKEVAERTKEIETQRIMLKEKNEDFVSSVKYAERIQSALLSNEQKFKSILPNSFVIFQPKDIVSGDFYWIELLKPTKLWPDELVVYATADCTGHGVPGAFVSIICNNLLKLGKTHPDVQSPGQALDFVSKEINETLNSEYSDEQIRDGMDISLCTIDRKNRMLYFAGAKNGVYIVRDKELIEIKGDRHGIGYTDDSATISYTTQEIQLEKGDILYTCSDGYVDQFGGPRGKKFGSKRLKELLLSISNEPLNNQGSTLENAFDIWKDEEEQVDDMLFIGVRID